MKNNLTDDDFSLGSLEAWDEEERNHLEEVFYPIKEFCKILEDKNIILCGRRGSGKSAIAIMLQKESKFKIREAIPGEHEQYGVFLELIEHIVKNNYIYEGIDIRKTIAHLWKWLLPFKAIQTFLTYEDLNNNETLDKYVDMINYMDSMPEQINLNSSIGHVLSITTDKAITNYTSSGIFGFNSYLLNLSQNILFKKALNSLREETISNPILLIFDTLESYKIFEPFMIDGLQGILDALLTLKTDERMDNILIKFFFPAEVYDDVIYPYPGKIQSKSVFLRWKVRDLGFMIANRFLRILRKTEAVDKDSLLILNNILDDMAKHSSWKHLLKTFYYDTKFLPSSIKNKLGAEENTFAYVIRHTQRRPRDVMAVMQSIINKSRERNEFPYISAESVVSGVHNPTILQQILRDALIPYQGKLPFSLIDTAKSTFYDREVIMDGRELIRFATELYNINPISNINSEEFVKILINCGLIGLVLENPPKNENEMYCLSKFEYIMQGTIPLSERFLYSVHPAMGDCFNMISPKNRGAIYPYPDYAEDKDMENEIGI